MKKLVRRKKRLIFYPPKNNFEKKKWTMWNFVFLFLLYPQTKKKKIPPKGDHVFPPNPLFHDSILFFLRMGPPRALRDLSWATLTIFKTILLKIVRKITLFVICFSKCKIVKVFSKIVRFAIKAFENKYYLTRSCEIVIHSLDNIELFWRFVSHKMLIIFHK